MLGILGWVVMIGFVICWIIVVIKIFQNDGALKGILALICWLFALIWGWMHAGRLGVKNIMMIWTVLLILCIIISAMGGFNFSYSVGTPMTAP